MWIGSGDIWVVGMDRGGARKKNQGGPN